MRPSGPGAGRRHPQALVAAAVEPRRRAALRYGSGGGLERGFPASNGTLARAVPAQSAAFGASGAPVPVATSNGDLKETNRCDIV